METKPTTEQLQLNELGEDDGDDNIPEELENPAPKTQEAIPSQEICSLKTPNGLEIQTGSQLLTPQALHKILLKVYDHVNQPTKTKEMVGVG